MMMRNSGVWPDSRVKKENVMGRPPKEIKIAESVSEGVNKVEKDEDDVTVKLMDDSVMTKGNWVKVVSMDEVADLEAKGRLKGFRPETMEVLCLESLDF
jgi:hypothetical protein